MVRWPESQLPFGVLSTAHPLCKGLWLWTNQRLNCLSAFCPLPTMVTEFANEEVPSGLNCLSAFCPLPTRLPVNDVPYVDGSQLPFGVLSTAHWGGYNRLICNMQGHAKVRGGCLGFVLTLSCSSFCMRF